MKTRNVRYQPQAGSAFASTLSNRIDAYFAKNNISKKANTQMVVKTFFYLGLVFTSYGLIISGNFGQWTMLGLAVVFGLSTLCVLFNIAHDAAHNAYSSSPFINKLIHLTFYIIGANPYIWKLKHNLNHHNNTNVPGFDWTIGKHGNTLDFTPSEKQSFQKKYQWVYAPMLYPFYTLFLVFYKDFQMLFIKQIGNVKNITHPTSEYVKLIITKALYLVYTLILPMYLLDNIVWWKVLLAFLIMHGFAGILLCIAAILPHLNEETVYPEPNEDGVVNQNWVTHALATTVDIAPESRLANWILGGLNTHVIHHLQPGICHIHYRQLTKIIKSTCEEFNIPYHYKSLWGAITSHLRFLKSSSTQFGAY